MEAQAFGIPIEQLSATTPTHHTRSQSDNARRQAQSQLSPSPKFKEPPPKIPRDDNVIISTPSKLSGRVHRESLVLQMPPRDQMATASGTMSGRSTPMQSPQVERENTFESPTSMLPRHSRGLDFSRACTNLHHSTIPDQSSPDSSPKVSHRALKIPSRRQSTVSSMVMDSPRSNGANSFWNDRAFRPRSLGSTTAATTSEASSSDSDSDEEMKSRYDPDDVLSTPIMHKQANSVGGITPYGSREETVIGGALHNPSPISRRYTPYRRSTKGSGGRLAVLRTQHLNGIEENNSSGSSTDPNEMPIDTPIARRDSISTVTRSLQLSTNSNSNSQDSDTETSPAFKFQSPQVVRRPVTRRSNLLPKTKGFARIRAALQEESSPVDTDIRRDAEVVRQVRVGSASNTFIPELSTQSTACSSPDLNPTLPERHPMDGTDMGEIDALGVTLPTTEGGSYTSTVSMDERSRNSTGNLFAHLLAPSRLTTTPPPFFRSTRHRSSSGALSEDARMESLSQTTVTNRRSQSQSSPERETPEPFPAPPLPSAAEVLAKAHGKRRRDDDFDPSSIKRRAVSPGMSVHSSPVLGQSPVSSTSGWWGKPKESRENSGKGEGREGSITSQARDSSITSQARDSSITSNGRESSMTSQSQGQSQGQSQSQSKERDSQSEATQGRGERSASIGSMAPPSTPSLGARRIPLQQGMSDTSDGLVRMTLE